MADEHAVEPPPGTPGQRALGAMESAVRRAREASGKPPLPPPEPATVVAPPPTLPIARQPDRTPPTEEVRPAGAVGAARVAARVVGTHHAPVGDVRLLEGARPLGDVAPRNEIPLDTDARTAARPNRWLIGSVAVVAALVVAAAIALTVSVGGGSAPPSTKAAGPSQTSTPASRTPSTNAAGAGTHPTTSSTTPTTTASSTSTSTAAAVAPGGPPTITSLSPSSGPAGQSITVTGANFLSSSGQIVATFNGQVAPTRCPAPNTCTLTAPASTSASARVVITTSGGSSNAVTFTYS